MSMLNFRYGKFSGLFNTDGSNKLGLNEGTVYITTDEKAMYVDLNTGTSVERIRLSQIVNLPTIKTWNDLKPPYSTEAFYYIIEANALLKYTGSEWKQINSTSELESELSQLAEDLGKLTQTVNNNANTMNTHITTTTGNPHNVTKAEVGLGNVDDKSVATIKSEFTASGVTKTEANFTTGAQVYAAVEEVNNDLNSHTLDQNNPHKVTKAQVGLENVDNTSDADKPVSTLQGEAIAQAKSDVLGKSTDAAGANTVAGANKAAAAAKEYAEGVQTNLTTHEDKKNNPHEVTATQLGVGDFKDKTVAGIKAGYTADSIADNEDGFTTGDQVFDFIQALRGSYTGTLEALNTAIGTNAQNISSHTTDKNNPHEVTAAQLGVGDFKDQTRAGIKTAWTSNGIADSDTGFTTGDQVFEYIKTLKDGYTGSLDDLDDAIGQNATDIAGLSTTVSNLDTRLTTALQTADALKYIGTVAAFNNLPTTSSNPAPANGWTYKATAKFSLTAAQSATGNAVTVYIGDLLIAIGTESNGVITSNLKWDHIPSGYVADYNPKFSLSGADPNGTALDDDDEVTINLTSGAASNDGDLGKIAFKTDGNSAIRITATNTAANAASLTLSLAWGTF